MEGECDDGGKGRQRPFGGIAPSGYNCFLGLQLLPCCLSKSQYRHLIPRIYRTLQLYSSSRLGRYQQPPKSGTPSATSRASTMKSSPSPLFSSLVSENKTSTNTSPERPPRQPIRKRPQIIDLRQYQSTPTVTFIIKFSPGFAIEATSLSRVFTIMR